jgi:hypothetical protein
MATTFLSKSGDEHRQSASMDQKNEVYTCKTGSEQGYKFKVKMILAKVP